MSDASNPPLAVSIGQAAKLIGVSESTVRQLVATDGIPYRRILGRTVIPIAALERWLEPSDQMPAAS